MLEWNNLDKSIRISETFSFFKKSVLKLIRLPENSIFNCHNPKRIKVTTIVRLGLSHLQDHKLQKNFQDLLDLTATVELISKQLFTISVTDRISQMKYRQQYFRSKWFYNLREAFILVILLSLIQIWNSILSYSTFT